MFSLTEWWLFSRQCKPRKGRKNGSRGWPILPNGTSWFFMFLVLLLVLFATTLDKIVFLPNRVYTKGNSLPQKNFTTSSFFCVLSHWIHTAKYGQHLESFRKESLIAQNEEDDDFLLSHSLWEILAVKSQESQKDSNARKLQTYSPTNWIKIAKSGSTALAKHPKWKGDLENICTCNSL